MTGVDGAGERRATERYPTEDEAIAAAVAVLAAIGDRLTPAPEPVATRSVWGRRQDGWATGADAWWASGLPR